MLLLACASPDDSGKDPAEVDVVATLAAPGPYAVGHRDDTVDYVDPGGADRSLHLSTWDPSTATSGEAATYFYGSVTSAVAWQDAAPAAGPFPLLVFSHGHQGYAENSSFLMEHLASHGYVVAAPDHTGNTTLDGGDRATEIYYQRPADLSAVIDAAQGGLFSVTDEVLALGHSFGGYTVLALAGATYDPAALDCPDPTDPFCVTMTDDARAIFEAGLGDPRILASLAMAAGDFDKFGAGLGTIGGPVFQMTASEDQGPGSEADDLFAALPADKLRLSIEGAGHQSFTDFADSMEDVPLDAADGWRIIDVYALAWVNAHLGDSSMDAVLDGTLPVSDAATLTR